MDARTPTDAALLGTPALQKTYFAFALAQPLTFAVPPCPLRFVLPIRGGGAGGGDRLRWGRIATVCACALTWACAIGALLERL